MKKPNITKGEWTQKDYWVESNEQPAKVIACTANAHVDDDIKLANAKAFCAVPEMIGALIEAHKVLSKMNYNPEAKEINRLHHGIKFALKKAGCTDE